MKGEPTDGVGFGLIFGVANDGAADLGKLEPDLMTAASFQSEFDEGAAHAMTQDSVMGDGFTCAGAGPIAHEDAVGLAFINVAAEGAGVGRWGSFDEGEVAFLKVLPVGLEEFFGLLGLGEEEDAGGLAVETMDDPDAGATAVSAVSEVGVQEGVGGALLLTVRGHGEKVGRLVDDDDGVVLVKHGDALGEVIGRRRRGFGGEDGDAVSGGEGVVVLGDDFVVHMHGTVFEPLLDLRALHFRPGREKERLESLGLGHGLGGNHSRS